MHLTGETLQVKFVTSKGHTVSIWLITSPGAETLKKGYVTKMSGRVQSIYIIDCHPHLVFVKSKFAPSMHNFAWRSGMHSSIMPCANVRVNEQWYVFGHNESWRYLICRLRKFRKYRYIPTSTSSFQLMTASNMVVVVRTWWEWSLTILSQLASYPTLRVVAA